MFKHARNLNLTLIAAGLLPTAILLALCARMLYFIWPDLNRNQQYGALEGLFVVALPGAATVTVGLWGLYRNSSPGKLLRLALLGLAIVCFYSMFHVPQHPPSGRSWQFNTDDYMTTLIAGQLPLFYVLVFLLASAFSIQSKRGLIWGAIGTIAAPVILYVGFQSIRFLPHDGSFAHLLQIVFLCCNAVFSFLLLRLLIYAGRHHAARLENPAALFTMQLIFTGILPFIGLLLNYWGPVSRESQMVLGNFTAREFWLLSLGNAIVYMLPRFADFRVNLVLLALRATGFVFVLYFCIVFLLFLPLALALIIAFGLGLLLLIPYLALLMQIVSLRRDFKYFATGQKTRTAVIAVIAGALLLPAAVMAHVYADRSALRDVIAYVQHPPLSLNTEAPAAVERILRLAAPAGREQRGIRHNEHFIPIYDLVYKSIVFDGAELNETLRQKILQIFTGNQAAPIQPRRTVPQTAYLDSVETQSTTRNGLTYSTLKLRIANRVNTGQAEFDTQIQIPDGVFISGHWLTIDGVEVPAQITTRNTAIWVYNRVTERLRDPSLIYYEDLHTLRWKVFPVPARSQREARLEILHPYDATINIAGKKVELKAANKAAPHFSSSDGSMHLFAPALAGELTTRRPYIHFIVDCGRDALGDPTSVGKRVAEKLGLNYAAAKVSYVHSAIRSQVMPQDGRLQCNERQGGFFAELALRSVLHSARASGHEFPVAVVLSSARSMSIPSLAYAEVFYADADGFVLASDKEIHAYDFSGQRLPNDKPHFPLPVRGSAFLPGRTALADASGQTGGERFPALDGVGHFYAYWSGEHRARSRAVLHAIDTGVMNPATGSIVLETEGQRRKLAELHKKMLSAHNEFEAGEARRMSEPVWYLIPAFMLLLWRFFFRKSEKKKRFSGI